MNNLSIFADRLNELLMDTGDMKVKEFANKVGATPSVAYRWLKGTSFPTLENLVIISNLFGVSIDFLLGRVQEQYPFTERSKPDFPKNLAAVMTDKGITEYRLCKETKISRSKISSWKKGASQPLPDGLIKLADYLNCSIDRLLGRES